jgi:HD-GYP domain-containing protein (c-di-GMP phosphodiesterase class II)
LAAILHDIGAFSELERLRIMNSQFEDNEFDRHCEIGYRLLKSFEPLRKAAEIIRHHHAFYDESESQIPIGSYIVHLADRIAVTLNDNEEVLEQIPGVAEVVFRNKSVFNPKSVDALKRLAKVEYIWIETYSPYLNDTLRKRMGTSKRAVDLNGLRDFAKLIASFIDYRSPFTSSHSSGVAAVATELTELSGFSERECKLMEIAGYLHDIGKLAVPNDILEKKGALNEEEVRLMRKHTYYTYVILNRVRGLEHISTWAAYHHERLDGNGYPFHVAGENISKLDRVMAVADVFTAITEDRPYRAGMTKDNAMKVLNNMVAGHAIDPMIVDIVRDNYEQINELRIKAQTDTIAKHKEFSDKC